MWKGVWNNLCGQSSYQSNQARIHLETKETGRWSNKRVMAITKEDLIQRLKKNSEDSQRVQRMPVGERGRLDLSFKALKDMFKIIEDTDSAILNGDLTNAEKLEVIS